MKTTFLSLIVLLMAICSNGCGSTQTPAQTQAQSPDRMPAQISDRTPGENKAVETELLAAPGQNEKIFSGYGYDYFSENDGTGGQSAGAFSSGDIKSMVWREEFTPHSNYDDMKYLVDEREMGEIRKIATKLMEKKLSKDNAKTINVKYGTGFLGIASGVEIETIDETQPYSRLYYMDSVVRFEEMVKGDQVKDMKHYYYDDSGNPVLMLETLTTIPIWNWFDYDGSRHLRRIIRTDFSGNPLGITLFVGNTGYDSVDSYQFVKDKDEFILWEVTKYSTDRAVRYNRKFNWRETRLVDSFLERIKVPEKSGFRSLLVIPKPAENKSADMVNNDFIRERIEKMLQNPPKEDKSCKVFYSRTYNGGALDFFLSPGSDAKSEKPGDKYTKTVFSSGRLVMAHTAPDDYREHFWYDRDGRPLLRSLVINGKPFSYTYVNYDQNGRLNRISTVDPKYKIIHFTEYIFGDSGIETRSSDGVNMTGSFAFTPVQFESMLKSPETYGMKRINIGY